MAEIDRRILIVVQFPTIADIDGSDESESVNGTQAAGA